MQIYKNWTVQRLAVRLNGISKIPLALQQTVISPLVQLCCVTYAARMGYRLPIALTRVRGWEMEEWVMDCERKHLLNPHFLMRAANATIKPQGITVLKAAAWYCLTGRFFWVRKKKIISDDMVISSDEDFRRMLSDTKLPIKYLDF